eukprot:SAG11_NODE_21419_length_425_cov_1.101227_1_plen_88_part_00
MRIFEPDFRNFAQSPFGSVRLQVIGVDMTAEMLSLSRRNAIEAARAPGAFDNVQFRLGEVRRPLEHSIALPSLSAAALQPQLCVRLR